MRAKPITVHGSIGETIQKTKTKATNVYIENWRIKVSLQKLLFTDDIVLIADPQKNNKKIYKHKKITNVDKY